MKDVNMCLKVRSRNLNEMLNENDTTNGKRTQKQTTEVRTTGRNNVYSSPMCIYRVSGR